MNIHVELPFWSWAVHVQVYDAIRHECFDISGIVHNEKSNTYNVRIHGMWVNSIPARFIRVHMEDSDICHEVDCPEQVWQGTDPVLTRVAKRVAAVMPE